MAAGITEFGPENAAIHSKTLPGMKREDNEWLSASGPLYETPIRISTQADRNRRQDNYDKYNLGFAGYVFKKIGARLRRFGQAIDEAVGPGD